MIFVTVGTHEQPFNRLVKAMDMFAKTHPDTNVFIQTGYSTYEPKFARYEKFISPSKMNEYTSKSNIIISHGGPSSFMKAVELGKVPIVVPREATYNEHVNNHQVTFTKEINSKYNNLLIVTDISTLPEIIEKFGALTETKNKKVNGHNAEFNQLFESEVNKILEKG